jgi:hypothetical protein
MATMYDAEADPSACPDNSPIVAYYPYGVDGAGFTYGTLDKSQFPAGTKFVTIDNSKDGSHPDCDVADYESAFMYPASVVANWLQKKAALKTNGGIGVVYCAGANTHNNPTPESNADHGKLLAITNKFLWWTPDWTGEAHAVAGAVAVQYAADNPSSPNQTHGYGVNAVTSGWPASLMTGGNSPSSSPSSSPGGGGSGSGLGSVLSGIAGFFDELGEPSTWLRVGLVVGGLVACYVGVRAAMKTQSARAASLWL